VDSQVKVLEKAKVSSWVSPGLETKIDCAGENQQQFTRPTGPIRPKRVKDLEVLLDCNSAFIFTLTAFF
jgi:hypothetical protein